MNSRRSIKTLTSVGRIMPHPVSLRVGTTVGPYTVAELLGEGGMGTVFRAHDPRLARDVALKVIRPELAADPERLARFEREARLLGGLTHPNIATVYGFEEVAGERLLVMELVHGATLDQRIREGSLSVDEALRIAAQIAAGVEAAHAQGVIHRDLKPSNIKLTPEGGVKVLDFGLAKALATSGSISHAPTRSSGGTADGLILGTIAYMSPEQARGKDVDTRTDIWSFGCVLFDLLTGKAAFAGDTMSDTIAAILTRDPDWSLLPPATPSSITRLLRRCLVKDVRRRLRDIGDARIEIEDALLQPDAPAATGITTAIGPAPRHPAIGGLAIGVALGVVTGALAAWALLGKSEPGPQKIVQFTLPLTSPQRLAGTDFPAVALSPDDSRVAYIGSQGGQQQIFVRDLAATVATPLAGTDGAIAPFFSPDGMWIAFFAGGKLKKVQVSGGPVREITTAAIGFGGSWGADGTIVFAPDNGSALWRVSADGGEAKPITALDTGKGEFSHRWPELLPDGRRVMFTVSTQGSWDDAEIVVQDIDGGARRTIVHGGTSPHYLADGRVLYARGGALYAVPLDGNGAGQTSTAAAPLAEAIAESLDGAAQASVSRAGSLLYVTATGAPGSRTLVWVDRAGRIQPLAAPPRAYESPRLSPDGAAIAFAIKDHERDEVWTYDVARAALTQFTFGGGMAPAWSPDGRRLAFSSTRDGLPVVFSRATDGSGTDERRGRSTRGEVPTSVAPDGTIACVESTGSTRDIVLLHPGEANAVPFLATAAAETAPAFSPDGRWLAFVSNSSGSNEVYVTAAADASHPLQVSSGGGTEPVWRRDGSELFFRSGDKLMVARVRTRPSLSVDPAAALFEANFATGAASRPGYDVSADGARFLMVREEHDDNPVRELQVFLGWLLRR